MCGKSVVILAWIPMAAKPANNQGYDPRNIPRFPAFSPFRPLGTTETDTRVSNEVNIRMIGFILVDQNIASSRKKRDSAISESHRYTLLYRDNPVEAVVLSSESTNIKRLPIQRHASKIPLKSSEIRT